MKKESYAYGLEAAMAMIGGKWKILILWQLANGTKRFGELRRLVSGVSEKMLIQELKELTADGITRRHDFNEVPPKVEYSLTEFGMSLAVACTPLCDWGSDHMERIVGLAERRRVPGSERPSRAATQSTRK